MEPFAPRFARLAQNFGGNRVLLPVTRRHSSCINQKSHHSSKPLSTRVAHLKAPQMSYSENPEHVKAVAEQLRKEGILKITLGFQDSESRYLQKLIRSLHHSHNHQLPISHSATQGWFWDVRPSASNFQTANHQARSETMEDFPWHTDCSYEYPPPRFFALQVLQPDRFGGGTLSVMSVERLSEHLGAEALATLMRPEYRITIPTEFVKDPAKKSILGSLILPDEKGAPSLIRFREDIITPLTASATAALNELKSALQILSKEAHSTLHLSAQDLPGQSIILIDNRRWLHARNHVTDPQRHLRRVRWDAAPFPVMGDDKPLADSVLV